MKFKTLFTQTLIASLSVCMILSTPIITFAKAGSNILDETIKSQAKLSPRVYSTEYPDAFIIVTSNTNKKDSFSYDSLGRDNKLDNCVTATVFVEETYKNVNGEDIITSSRLLSKDEVDLYGAENFEKINSVQAKKSSSSKKGKLTITFNGSYSKKGKGITASLKGNAKWSGVGGIAENRPAVGDDFIGISWAGGFEASNSKCTVTTYPSSQITATLTKSDANAGRVYSFKEYINAGGKYTIYASNIDISTKLSKKKLTGSGNTAEAVLQYTHTYQAATGSVSINKSGAGFTLSSTPKQWSLSCVVNGIPY